MSNRLQIMRALVFVVFCAASIFALDVGDTTAVITQDDANPRIKSRYPAISLDAYFDRALRRYTEVIEKKPTANAYLNRAMIWGFKGEHDKQMADYNDAIRLDPRCAATYRGRGSLWLDKGEHDKAMADYNEAIRLDPKVVSVYCNRGDLWREKGEHDKAMADYNEAIRLDWKCATAYSNRGDLWREQGEHDRAIADYSEAIRRVSWGLAHHDHTCAKLAWLLATSPVDALRDGKKAIQHATRACELTEWKNCEWIDTLAAAYAESGDFDEAVKWQKSAMSMCPENLKDVYRSRLGLYKSGEPYRVEWQGN